MAVQKFLIPARRYNVMTIYKLVNLPRKEASLEGAQLSLSEALSSGVKFINYPQPRARSV